MSTLARFHYGYVIVFCCCLIMGVNIGLVMSCAGVFYKPVSSALGISVGNFGLYMTFVYSFSFLMLSVAGKMMDKYSARWLLTMSSGIVGLVYLAMSQFNSEPLEIGALNVVMGRRSFAGSNIGGIAETQEMLEFCFKHDITAEVERIDIDYVNDALDRLEKGDVKYRFVIDMASF